MTGPTIRPEPAAREEASPVSRLALWAGALIGPVTFLVLLQVNYLLVMWTCSAQAAGRWPLHLASLLGLGAVAYAGWLSYRNSERTGRALEDEGGGAVPRSRFLSTLGLMTSTLFFYVVLAMWVTTFLMSPCTRA